MVVVVKERDDQQRFLLLLLVISIKWHDRASQTTKFYLVSVSRPERQDEEEERQDERAQSADGRGLLFGWSLH